VLLVLFGLTLLWLRLKLTCLNPESAEFTSLDVYGYVALCYTAFDVVLDILVIRMLYTESSIGLSEVEVSDAETSARVALLLFLLPVSIAMVALWLAMRSKALILEDKFGEHAAFYSAVLFLALSNLDLLRIVPWIRRSYDGFPTLWHLGLASVSLIFEDVPQLIYNALLIATPGTDPVPVELILAFALGVVHVAVRCARIGITLRCPSKAMGNDGLRTRVSLQLRKSGSSPLVPSEPAALENSVSLADDNPRRSSAQTRV